MKFKINSDTNNKLFAFLLSLLILPACVTQPVTQIQETQVSSSGSILALNVEKKPTLEMLIEQKKNNGEIISIGSKGVQSVSIDGHDYPLNKLVQNQFKIEITEIIPGKHELSLSLYLVKETFKIPLIIPDINIQSIIVLIRLTIDEKSQEVQKIEYGYDLDRNGIIDIDSAHYESVGTSVFYAISKDGIRQKIDIALNTEKTIPNEQVPPGIVPSSGSTGKTTDISQPVIPSIEPPKPITTDLYPLPPGVSLPEPTPIPIGDDKKE